MKRPDSPELDAVLTAAEDLRALEARVAAEIAEAKRQLAAKVDAFAEIVEPSDRIKVAVYAYWHAPEVSANQLAVLTVGKPSAMAMLKHFGSVSAGIACDRCGRDLPITSRSMMADVLKAAADDQARWREGYRFVCPTCRAEIYDARDRVQRDRDLIREERQRVLAAMTYVEYLGTPEWQGRRQGVMSWMLEERGMLTCEVCPEREGLSFVHSQFDLAAGQEAVTLLCRTCSTALLTAGKLGHAPLPANRVGRTELDRAETEFRTHRHGGPPDAVD